MKNHGFIVIVLILLALLGLYIVYRKNFKRIVIGAVVLVTGAVKVGKSLLCVYLAEKEYKARHRLWWFRTKVLGRDVEEPLFYTNVPVSFGKLGKKAHRLDKNIVQIELAHLMREKRFNYKSVVYIQESSLMADNQDFNNNIRNAELSMFNKLFGHETKGGVLFYDTQCISDNHYAIKRVLSSYFFIQKSLNFWLFRVCYVREMINNELGENNFNDDLDTTTRKVLIFRRWYKKYDCYYFSYLTDKLSKKNKKQKFYNGAIVSFNPLYRALSNTRSKESKELLKKYEKNQKNI